MCDGRISVENAYLEEKEDACCALGELAQHTRCSLFVYCLNRKLFPSCFLSHCCSASRDGRRHVLVLRSVDFYSAATSLFSCTHPPTPNLLSPLFPFPPSLLLLPPTKTHLPIHSQYHSFPKVHGCTVCCLVHSVDYQRRERWKLITWFVEGQNAFASVNEQ